MRATLLRRSAHRARTVQQEPSRAPQAHGRYVLREVREAGRLGVRCATATQGDALSCLVGRWPGMPRTLRRDTQRVPSRRSHSRCPPRGAPGLPTSKATGHGGARRTTARVLDPRHRAKGPQHRQQLPRLWSRGGERATAAGALRGLA
ncbi:hypothetical protein ERJ75_001632100 [Trypanosoma vivax]|nr:hypothetical protein ERJ75_001632100 [Trypanosoma vivax]